MPLAMLGRSISNELRAVYYAWLMMFRERMYLYGISYAFNWLLRPIFEVALVALIYVHGDRERVPYIVVALAANTILFSAIFYVGEILDNERVKGTLPGLFLAPCHRVSWMTGYAFAGMGETLGRVLMILIAGFVLFDIQLDPNFPSLFVVIPIFLLALSGIALILSGIGLLIKRANSLSNLVSPFVMLLGGVYFPVASLPRPLEYVARALPIAYAMETISAIAVDHASLADVRSSLIPLLGFAVVSPIIGLVAFNKLDMLVRRRGEVDIY